MHYGKQELVDGLFKLSTSFVASRNASDGEWRTHTRHPTHCSNEYGDMITSQPLHSTHTHDTHMHAYTSHCSPYHARMSLALFPPPIKYIFCRLALDCTCERICSQRCRVQAAGVSVFLYALSLSFGSFFFLPLTLLYVFSF